MTKVDIFSGFLGAGKTTLIKKLIPEAFGGEKLVLIENEFGEIGIDGGFLEEAGIEVTEMNSGCICCSLVGDFGEALKKVLEQYSPDRILIEPSGVGKLSDVIRAVQDVGAEELQLNSFTAIVDANKCRMYMKNFGEFFNDQIEHANSIVLSRTAGISEDKLTATVELIRQHNADATLITTPWDELTGAQILTAMERRDTLDEELAHLKAESEHHHHHHHEHECECGHHHEHDHECECGHHEHDHECECGHHHEHDHECECGHHHEHDHECECGHHHEHDHECECGHHHHHHADEVFTSWGVETAKAFSAEGIAAALAALEDEEKYGAVLRAKGILKGENAWIHFDFVPGEINVREGSAGVTGRLCVIGAKLNESALMELFGV
ncbi:MAG: GTP-binding protein [Clostridia bacterium]|nr:GTP-binding protein [Clostridia bacterium]